MKEVAVLEETSLAYDNERRIHLFELKTVKKKVKKLFLEELNYEDDEELAKKLEELFEDGETADESTHYLLYKQEVK